MGLELSICDGFKGAENGKGSFCIANVRHLTAKRDHILAHQNRRNLTSATLQSNLNNSFKADRDREPRRLARRDAWALNSTIFLNTHIAAREQPPGPQSSLESVLWTPKTPEQRSRAV